MAAVPAAATAAREEDLQALRARIDTLKAELDERESSRREARDALRASETAISDATRALIALEGESRQLRGSVAELAGRRRGLEQDLAAREAALGRLLAARAMPGAPEPVRVALSGVDPNELSRQLYYLSVLSRAAARAIESHRAALAELARLREESGARVKELQELESRQRADRDRVLAERRERRRVLERIAGELRTGQRRMQRMLADEQRLTRVVQEIGRVLASRPGAGYRAPDHPGSASSVEGQPFARLRGSLSLPVRGELSGRFNAKRGAGGKGVFIRAPQGEPVKAVASGRVVYADWMRGFGNLLIIDHGESYLSVYGHNDSLLKRPGDVVGGGEAVATVGSSGGGEESGLYFELRHLGQAFDPLRWVRGR